MERNEVLKFSMLQLTKELLGEYMKEEKEEDIKEAMLIFFGKTPFICFYQKDEDTTACITNQSKEVIPLLLDRLIKAASARN